MADRDTEQECGEIVSVGDKKNVVYDTHRCCRMGQLHAADGYCRYCHIDQDTRNQVDAVTGGMRKHGSDGPDSQDEDWFNLFGKNRIENLIDAIYAISMTLLAWT